MSVAKFQNEKDAAIAFELLQKHNASKKQVERIIESDDINLRKFTKLADVSHAAIAAAIEMFDADVLADFVITLASVVKTEMNSGIERDNLARQLFSCVSDLRAIANEIEEEAERLEE